MKSTKTKPPYKDEDWLYEQYIENRLSQYDIAKIANCSQSAISAWLRKLGIPPRDHSESQINLFYKNHKDDKYFDKKWLATQYYDKELSTRKIAEIVGVYKNTIIRWMEYFGIARRNKEESTALHHKKELKDKKYNDADWLYDKYWNENMSLAEIGELVGLTYSAIRRWMIKLDISRREVPDALDRKYYKFDSNGEIIGKKCHGCNTFKKSHDFYHNINGKYELDVYCRDCKKRIRDKRRRNLGFKQLNKSFDNSEAHHVTDEYVIHIPRELHRKCYAGPDRELHRALVFNELVESEMLDEIDLMLGIYNTSLDEIKMCNR